MALKSGSFDVKTYTNSSYGGQGTTPAAIYMIVDWSEVSQNITANQTVLEVTLKLRVNNVTVGAHAYSISFGGQTVTGTANAVNNSSGSMQTYTLATRQITVAHGSDGSLVSNLVVEYAYCGTYSNVSIYYITNHNNPTSITLTPIARASTMSMTIFQVGGTTGTIAFNISAASSGFTHVLSYKYGSESETTITTLSARTTSYTWSRENVLSAFATKSSTSQTISVVFNLKTKNGNTVIGTKSYTKTLTYNTDEFKPTVSIEIAPYGGGSYYYQNITKMVITPTVTFKYGASVSSVSCTAGPQTFTKTNTSAITTGTFGSAGSVNVSYTVTDSRGFTVSTSPVSKTITAYSPPVISEVKLHRCASETNSTEDITGSYVSISFLVSVSSGQTIQSGYPRARYKRTTSSTWDWTIPRSDKVFTVSPATGGNMYTAITYVNPNYSFDFIFDVQDAISTSTVRSKISTAFCLCHVNSSGKGLAIGGLSFADDLNVYLPTVFETDVEMNYLKKNTNIYTFIKELSSSDNLNTCLQNGIYVQRTNANATSANNYPVSKAGFLEVLHNWGSNAISDPSSVMTGTQDRLVQRYTTFDSSSIWIRHFYDASGTGWSPWKRIFQDAPDSYNPNTLVSGTNTIGTMRVTKMNGIVVMRWNLNSGTLVDKGSSNYGTTALSTALDEEYWPAYTHYDTWAKDSYHLRYGITTSGVVSVYNYTTVTSASTLNAYLTTSWVAATQ